MTCGRRRQVLIVFNMESSSLHTPCDADSGKSGKRDGMCSGNGDGAFDRHSMPQILNFPINHRFHEVLGDHGKPPCY